MQTSDWIERSDLNYAEAMRELARRSGGVAHDEAGLLLYASASDLPVLSNGMMRTGGTLPAADALARARAFFAGQRRGYSIILRAHADADLATAAAYAGLAQLGAMPGLVLDRRLADAVPPAGVTLRRVATAADAAAFASVMDAAYASLGMPSGVAQRQFERVETLVAPHIVAFLATLDGTPAAGAMTIVTHGVAGIYWVGTRPAARGRGLAELCTRAAGNAGFDLGARIAALQASTMGEPIYLRMGYREVTRYPFFVQFEPPT